MWCQNPPLAHAHGTVTAMALVSASPVEAGPAGLEEFRAGMIARIL
jgi:hypothetical protein